MGQTKLVVPFRRLFTKRQIGSACRKTLGPLDTIFSVRTEIRKLGAGVQSSPSDLSTQRTRRNPFALEMGRPILPQLPIQF